MNLASFLGDVLGSLLEETELNTAVKKAKSLETWLMAVLYLSISSSVIGLFSLIVNLRKN